MISTPDNCNYIEIYIGKLQNNKFNCNITQEQFNIWKKKCLIYKNTTIFTKKLYYKEIIMESIYNTIYYQQNMITYTIDSNYLIQYYKNTPIKSSEFPNKKNYSYEEKTQSIHFFVDKNITIIFNYTPRLYIKIISRHTEKFNRHKLYNITQLFT